MAILYVYQGETYKEERAGGYLWSPRVKKDGSRTPGYYNMKKVKKGDYILHGDSGKTVAISIASKDYYEAEQPVELKNAKKPYKWDDKGYRVDTVYYDLTNHLVMANHYDWFKKNHVSNSAFQTNGKGKTSYLCNLPDEHARYILIQLIKINQDVNIDKILKDAMADIINEEVLEYDEAEKIEIDDLVSKQDGMNKPTWNSRGETQDFTNDLGTGKLKPKRDPQRAANALEIAEYYCEVEKSDKLFLRKNGKRYTEPHHLIPMCRYGDFSPGRIDIEENIVSLCSHCHNLLHYGRYEDKMPILERLYKEREKVLKDAGLDVSFEKLKDYYK